MIENLNEIFGADLTDVDLTRPLLKPNTVVEMEVFDIKVQENKDQTGNNLAIFLRTKYQEPDNKGGAFAAGYKPNGTRPTEYISLTETDKRDATAIKADLKRFRLAMGLSAGAFGSPEDYIGKTVKCRVTVEVDKTGQYPDKNRFNWSIK